MKYSGLVAALYAELWAIEPWKLAEIRDVLHFAAEGGDVHAEQMALLTKKVQAETARSQGGIMVLPLRGTIANRMNLMNAMSGGTSSEVFGQEFRSAINNPDVKAVVLDVDSPGGMVAGTDELSSLVHSARGTKPIIAHVNSRAASAAYWIATAADEVVVNPSASVGSIGVISAHDDLSARMKTEGVNRTLITSSKYKAEGHPFGPLEDEARAHIQRAVDKSHGVFVKTVARNRGRSQTDVRDNFGQGRMVDADDAVSAGMADSIATLDQTLARFGGQMRSKETRRAFPFERERRAAEL